MAREFSVNDSFLGRLGLHGLHWGSVGLILGFVLSVPAVALEIRVGLRQGVEAMTVGCSTPADITDGKGASLGQLAALQGFSADAVVGGVKLANKKAPQMVIRPKDHGFVYVGDRWYRGKVKLVPGPKGLTVINELNLEDYLASVIGKEMYPTWPIEALKTQAVASRSFALYRKQHPRYKLFDVLSTTTSQVYTGLDSETISTQEAVKATSGQVLAYQGKVIEAVFHSSSGGHTENSEDVWVKPVPYLRGVPDFDQTAPVYQWTTKLTADQMRQRLTGVGDILSFSAIKATTTGRVQTIKVQGSRGDRIMQGRDMRTALGLRSTLFQIKPEFESVAGASTPPTKPTSFQISGRGSGHGLGMSQWGAYSLAEQGKTYRDILLYYFKGTNLQTFP